jgi:hypothetical protein
MDILTSLICKRCKEEKSPEDFRVYRIEKGLPRHFAQCTDCTKILQKIGAKSRAKRKSDRGASQYQTLSSYSRRKMVLRRYGLTVEQFDNMLKEQKGLCYMCHKPNITNRAFHVDHNHTTGKVRKLLCHRCNNGLRFIEDTKFMQRALTYLSEQEG